VYLSHAKYSFPFRLRDIHDTKVPGPDGTTLEDRMSSLVKDIAKDISEAGSACDHYLKKSFWGMFSLL